MSAGSSDRTMFGDWWLDVFGDKPAHLRFVLEVARYANDKSGEVSVAVGTIAKRMGIDERHAWRYRAEAIKAGIMVEIGRKGRTKSHRLNYSNPGNDCQGADRQGLSRTLATVDANPGNEEQRTLATVVDANGTRTVLKNGSIDRPPEFLKTKKANEVQALPEDLRSSLALALKAHKVSGEIDSEIRAMIRQVGCENIPRLVGWLNSDLSRATNPVGLALSQTLAGKDAPRETRAGLHEVSTGQCTDCDVSGIGQMLGGEFWCLSCIEATRKTFCGNMLCRMMHYPWESCDGKPKRAKIHGYFNGRKCAVSSLSEAPNGWMDVPPRGKRMADLWPEHRHYGIDHDPLPWSA